ncbi:MAG: CvpA family protein [Candidatus Brocadiia bacterium]|jgi:hypothetical protein
MLVLADVVTLAVVAVYAVRGFMRGLTSSLLGLLGLAGAFFAAWLLWGWAGRRLNESFGIPLVLACALGATFVFLVVYVMFFLLVHLIRRRNKSRKAQPAPKPKYPWADKLSGAALGACVGMLMAAALVWIYNAAGLTPGATAWPDMRDSAASRLSSLIIGSEAYLFARAATNDPALSRVVARSVSDPKMAVEDVQRIKQNPEVAALARDAQFTDAVFKGDAEAIKGNPRWNRLMEDPEFLRCARDLGLLPAESDAASTREQAADQLARVGRKMTQIGADPEVQDLLRDKAFQETLNDGDLGKLMQDERTWELAGRVMQIIRTDRQ